MTVKSRKELLDALRPLYSHVTWKEKQRVLDGFVAATGYNRKHAITLLNGTSSTSAAPSQRGRKYDNEVADALIGIWKASNRICSKRLIPFLPTIISSLEKFGHLDISDTTRAKLLSLSHSSADRLLKQERKKYAKRKSTTRPGYLLKKHIPIRTYSDWSDVRPGFLEADLVAHGGSSGSGQFLHTLTMTDIATGWTECSALICKSEVSVLEAFASVKKELPFPLLGLDTDNGSEFINHGVLKWCVDEKITFTRSREYKKNDQAHVEEKNGSIVRRLIGYDRFEGELSYRLLARLYRIARLYVNFFQPSLKLSSKERDGGNVRRIYQAAATPYQRLIASAHVGLETKKELEKCFGSLDPVALLAELEALQAEFWSTAVPVQEARGQSILKEFIRATVPKKKASPPTTSARPRLVAAKVWLPPAEYAGKKKGKTSNLDEVWDEVCRELDVKPAMTPRDVFSWLNNRYPHRFTTNQISTITERIRRWRYQRSLPVEFEKRRPGRKSNIDEVWQLALGVLEHQPNMSCRGLLKTLIDRFPDKVNAGQRTSLQERIKLWQKENLHQIKTNDQTLSISIMEEALSLVSQIKGN